MQCKVRFVHEYFIRIEKKIAADIREFLVKYMLPLKTSHYFFNENDSLRLMIRQKLPRNFFCYYYNQMKACTSEQKMNFSITLTM